ncbi:hypothetical protein BX666DRAFT_1933735 [Dichotomocladium elegans]|nr:hypothetical protein BX666DRAFT_1933735 [Dichotomocladium elegans]
MTPDTVDTVYRAVYSGITVFEIMHQGMPIMRRKGDSYLNATQILKLAGIDKGKRTKILEREILIGEHEKVQGGYGKFQGTWIPLEKGKELAERYGVHHLMRPLLEFDPSQPEDDIPTKDAMLVPNRRVNSSSNNNNNNNNNSQQSSQPQPSHQSPPPSPSSSSSVVYPSPRKRMRLTYEGERSVLTALFLNDDSISGLPELVDIDINMVIDDQGHTALHWAASLARIKMLEGLVARGADRTRVNYRGETALMRSVLMTHCYDNECFPRLLDILHDTISTTDYQRRTVLHHAVLSAATATSASSFPGSSSSAERCDAALFYMRHLLNYIQTSDEDRSIFDIRDVNGETCLAIATRLGLGEIVLALSGLSDSEDGDFEESEGSVRPVFSKKSYLPNPRGAELVSTVQKIVDALDEDYTTQLQERDRELERTQNKLWKATMELNEARRRLEEHKSETKQLDEAHQIIRQLEETLKSTASGSMNGKEEGGISNGKSARERWLEEKVKMLQAQVDAQTQNHRELAAQVDSLQTQSSEKEMQCKRLIAACCSLPVERIDSLLEPMLAAVTSDPPDLEFNQVIRFMDKLRHQQKGVNSIDNKRMTLG